jgi:hypothetical protein
MPHLFNNIWVVTEAELVPAYFTADALRQTICRYKDRNYGIKKVQSGGNGRQMLVAYDSLTTEIKNGLGDPRKSDHLMDLFYDVDADAVRFYTTYRFEDGTGLSLQHQEEYITNASVLRAAVLLRTQRIRTITAMGGTTKKVMSTVLSDVMSYNDTLQKKHGVTHSLPESEKRFKESFKVFETGFTDAKGASWKYNYNSLISGKLRNQNTRKVTDVVMSLLNDLFAGRTHKPSRTQVSREYDGFLQGYIEVVNLETGELYNPKEYKALSESTILRYLASWNEAIGTEVLRGGDRSKLTTKFRAPHKLVRPACAGEIISIDDRQPPFKYEKGLRPWFYNGIDLGSEAFTCWVYGKSKEGIITEFYRQMVRNYTEWGVNLPLELEAEASLNSSFTGTFLQPGRMFDHVRIEANNPRGKRIERYYGELRYEYEKDRAGWLARPHALSEKNQAAPGAEQIIPYEDIIDGCLKDIEEWNNQPHSVYPKMSRWEFFIKQQHAATKPTNWRGILPYLGYATKTSCSYNGVIKLQGKTFLLGEDGKVCLGEQLISLMDQVAGEDVVCYWLDGNDGEVLKALVMLGDKIVCEAVPQPEYSRSKVGRVEGHEELRTVMSSYVATTDAYMKERSRSIKAVVLVDNTPKPERLFKMPGIKRYEVNESEEAKVLPDVDDEVVMVSNNNNRKSLKDTL